MSEKHIDEVSGVETTGHEWDGIRELNNPMPRWWVLTFYVTILWAIGYVVVYPAIPMVTSATKGYFGYSSRAELQQVRESIALVGVRAAGIRTSLETLQRSQAASGLNLRGDMQAAANLMNSYLDGADAALNAGDVAQAKSFLEKAEPQVQKLEKFLNR